MINKKTIIMIILNLIILSTLCCCERSSSYNTVSTNITPVNSPKSTLEPTTTLIVQKTDTKNDTNLISAPTEIAKEVNQVESQNVDPWIGDYIFSEHVPTYDDARFHEALIYKENNNYYAKINILDGNIGVYYHLQAKVKGDNNSINFVFDKYLPDEQNTHEPYKKGDILFAFKKTNTGLITYWGRITPIDKKNKEGGEYFTKRENSDGYIGNWYDSLPYTGGNSNVVKIKDMTSTSVKFDLYFCRTARFDNISCKLENNIAKFTQDDGEYKTSGTLEFVNKSIVVKIIKTDFQILEKEKTIFKYKVKKFDAVKMSPYNGATDVDIDKGIILTFDRRISPTTNPVAGLKKANVPYGPDDGYISMHVEIEGNKIICTPDYDEMKLLNKAIESGRKYEFIISEGEYRDDVGNIISDTKLEFTTGSRLQKLTK